MKPPHDTRPPPAPPRKASLLLGLRAGEEYRRDLQSIQPLHIVLVGLVALFAFVLGLILLVRWVV